VVRGGLHEGVRDGLLHWWFVVSKMVKGLRAGVCGGVRAAVR